MDIRPKVLITKIGLDGHDRGSRVVAAALRDAGMEVVYTPPWQEIATVVKLATEEDVDVIGVSSLASDHLIVPKLIDALRAGGLGDVPVIVGGRRAGDRRRDRPRCRRARAHRVGRRARVPSRRVARRHRGIGARTRGESPRGAGAAIDEEEKSR